MLLLLFVEKWKNKTADHKNDHKPQEFAGDRLPWKGSTDYTHPSTLRKAWQRWYDDCTIVNLWNKSCKQFPFECKSRSCNSSLFLLFGCKSNLTVGHSNGVKQLIGVDETNSGPNADHSIVFFYSRSQCFMWKISNVRQTFKYFYLENFKFQRYTVLENKMLILFKQHLDAFASRVLPSWEWKDFVNLAQFLAFRRPWKFFIY